MADERAVDGGHRAIKYTRVGGVGKEIYNEGEWWSERGLWRSARWMGVVADALDTQERTSGSRGSRRR